MEIIKMFITRNYAQKEKMHLIAFSTMMIYKETVCINFIVDKKFI